MSVIFRTRNLGTSASPPGTVAFQLGDGFEALDDVEVAVGSVAPGEDVVAVMRARVTAPLDDRTELAAQAALRVPGAVLGTNVCRVRVRSRPVLDGAASGTFVELVDADRVRVRAVVTNEGDGAARDVRVDVPPPAGCVRVDGDGPAAAEADRLDVGASVVVEFDAHIVEPVAVLAADGGEVRFGGERRCALPVREVVVMDPVIAPPCLTLRPSRRSVDIAVDVRNDGWADAHDVRVRIALPAPLRAVDGSIAVDGVPVAARGVKRAGGDAPFARVERSGGAHVVVVPVAARSTVRVALMATFPGGCAGGTVIAGTGAHEVAEAFAPELVRDVRMRLTEVPRAVAPGSDVRVLAELVNAGDVAEELFFCIAGPGVAVAPEAVARTVAPGSVVVVELTARANVITRAQDDAADREPLTLSVIACDAERERARAALNVAVRTPVTPCCDVPASDREIMSAVVHAALYGPEEVSAGAPFAIRLDVDVEDAVEMLTVRVPRLAGAAYVPGSTSLDGRLLLDRAGASPLAASGLSLRSVPAGTRVTAGWTLLADPLVRDEALIVEAVLGVDGEDRACVPIPVHVRGRDAFTAQPPGLRYHVDACVVESPMPEPEAAFADALEPATMVLPARGFAADEDAFTFGLRLDDDRLDAIARLLHGAAAGGLVPHVLALRAFFPDGETSNDQVVASALDGVRSALRDVFDRLFVKLRIPGFAVASDDFDDPTLRRTMLGLFERLLDAPAGSDRYAGASVRIGRERARELLAAFSGAPYGAPAGLRALVALLPTRCESDPVLSAALARYACALDDVLARYEGVPLELFDDALVRGTDRVLDDARAGLAFALRARVAVAEPAC